MFGRYSKVVPPHQKDLIRAHGFPRPNWYVGAAEQPTAPVDPQLRKEIDQIKSDLSGGQTPDERRDRPAPVDPNRRVSAEADAEQHRAPRGS
jgi:hypothetical protein